MRMTRFEENENNIFGRSSLIATTTIYDEDDNIIFKKVEIESKDEVLKDTVNTTTYQTNYFNGHYDQYIYDIEGDIKFYGRRNEKTNYIYAEEQYIKKDGEPNNLKYVMFYNNNNWESTKDSWRCGISGNVVHRKHGDFILDPVLRTRPIEHLEREFKVLTKYIKECQ